MHAQPNLILRLALLLGLLATAARADEKPSLVSAIPRISMTVSDLDKSIDFYTRVLSFEKLSESERRPRPPTPHPPLLPPHRVAQLKLGDEHLELIEYLVPIGRPIPPDSKSNDHWFQHIAIITPDMDSAYRHLRKHKVRHASPEPQTLPAWNANAAGIKAFYFHDPDHHVLEILEFPEGKGDPRWHRNSQLFLGIDHTAIVVADTEKSLAFYRDALGLKVVGRSDNHGPEQERLNYVEGARLRITTLRAASGPAIELLEYLTPNTGRPYFKDARPNDLLHWHVTLTTPSFADAAKLTTPLISANRSGPFLARDPDGHALLFSPVTPPPATASQN